MGAIAREVGRIRSVIHACRLNRDSRVVQPLLHRFSRRLIMWGLRGRERWWWVNDFAPRPDHATVPLPGGSRIRLQLGSLIDDAIYEGQFERMETDIFRRLLRVGDTVADVGANIGLYSLIAAKAVGAPGHVISFEPVPVLRTRLADNVRRNGFTNVTVVPNAVADKLGKAKLSGLEPGNHGLGSLGREGRGQSIEVAVTTLDHWLTENNSARINVLKIDVEGFEAEVLSGLSQLPAAVMLEYLAEGSARTALPEQMARFLSTHRIFRVESRNGLLRKVPVLKLLSSGDIGDVPATVVAVDNERMPMIASLIE